MYQKLLLFFVIMSSVLVQAWLQQRNVQFQNGMGNSLVRNEVRNIKKTFLPPRYQNLWGQGESSKVVGSSVPHNMEDFKVRTQQKHVFAWQPPVLNEW